MRTSLTGKTLVALLAVPTVSQAEIGRSSYKLVSASQQEAWYVDEASIRKTDATVAFAVLEVRDEYAPVAGRTPLFVIDQRKANCQTGALGQDQFVAYEASGRPIAARQFKATAWEAAQPNSLGSAAVDFVCTGRLRVQSPSVVGRQPAEVAAMAATFLAGRH